MTDATDDYALIAVQGPAAAGILGGLTSLDLGAMKYYAGAFGSVAGRPCWVARTGYTGEDGFEVFCRPPDAVAVWEAVLAAGAPEGLVPAGLAARDTLRLEAGMPLYGNELGPDMTPFEAGLGRVVKFDKPGDFVGRSALAVAAAAEPTSQAGRADHPVPAGGPARLPRDGGRGCVRRRDQRRAVPYAGPSDRYGLPERQHRRA